MTHPDFDSYLICATPRSGSTLLCGLLDSSGVAGHPASYFNRKSLNEYADDWRIARPRDGRIDEAFVRAALTAGKTSNGQKSDLAELYTLYRPDAVWIFASAGRVFPGREAIVDGIRQSLGSGPPRLKALTRFIEAPDLICAEGVAAEQFSGLVLDAQFYELFLLQAGAIRYRVNGMISPRPAEIAPVLQRQHDITINALQWAGQSFNPYPWRR